LTTAKGTRSDYYGIALRAFGDHPLRGDGAGGFEVRAATERRNNESVRNAHSLYHETLGDLGLVGFGFLAMFIGAVAFGALKARVRPAALARPQAAAVSAAVAVWLVHNAVDWDWQMASVTTVGLLLAGLLFPEGRRSRRRSSSPIMEG
jgi:O-antigen ligase